MDLRRELALGQPANGHDRPRTASCGALISTPFLNDADLDFNLLIQSVAQVVELIWPEGCLHNVGCLILLPRNVRGDSPAFSIDPEQLPSQRFSSDLDRKSTRLNSSHLG